jgi:osmoprotectant transport system substrate-binding protein
MYALLLEDAGLTVERKIRPSRARLWRRQRLPRGRLTSTPEYTGTGLLVVLKLPVSSDRQAVYDAVLKGFTRNNSILCGSNPAPMNNTQALAVTQEVRPAIQPAHHV